jgi:hypothetical protein
MAIIEIIVLLGLIGLALWMIVIGLGLNIVPKIKKFNEYNKVWDEFSEEINKNLDKEERVKMQEVLKKLKKK